MYTIAVYLKNWLPHLAIKDRTPYKVLYSKKPTISHLQPFGTECFVHILEEARSLGSKLQPTAKKGWFVRYTESTKIFIVYILSKRRVIYSSDSHFPKSTNLDGVQSLPTSAPLTTSASPPPPSAIITTTSPKPVT